MALSKLLCYLSLGHNDQIPKTRRDSGRRRRRLQPADRRDEDRTLARLRALRSDLIDPTIAVHNGRVVKRTGAARSSNFVPWSTRCVAPSNSKRDVERNAGCRPIAIEFRIGVHLGDVVEESEGDLMGDGVNIAARLEGSPSRARFVFSEDAYRQVRARLDLEVSDLGQPSSRTSSNPYAFIRFRSGSPRRRSLLRRRGIPPREKPAAPTRPSRQALNRGAAIPKHER